MFFYLYDMIDHIISNLKSQENFFSRDLFLAQLLLINFRIVNTEILLIYRFWNK